MLNKVLNNIGAKIAVISETGEKLGTTLGQIRLFKSNAKTRENSRVSELGIINDDTYVFIGSGEKDGKNVLEKKLLEFQNERFLILRSDFSRLKGRTLVWASLKKVKDGESA